MVERGIKEIENPEELLEMGLVSGIQSGMFDNAIEFFEKAIELEPENCRAWFLLGIAHDCQEHREDGNTCYKRALEINPDYIEALVNLGANYQLKESLALLAGYLYGKNPIPDRTFEPSLPCADHHIFSVGMDFKYKKIRFGWAYSFLLYETRNKRNTIDEFPDDGTLDPTTSANGEYKSEGHAIAFGLTYNF